MSSAVMSTSNGKQATLVSPGAARTQARTLRSLNDFIDYEQRHGATVVRIEKVRQILMGGTASNGR